MSADNPDTRIVENLLEAEQEANDQDFALSIRQLDDKIRLHSAAVLELHRENKALVTQLADAQETIAALQARVRELEEWVQDQSTANLETMRHMDEMQSRALEAESQLANNPKKEM